SCEHHRHAAPSWASSWQSMRGTIIGNTNRSRINTKFLTNNLRGDSFRTIAPERREHCDGETAGWANTNTHAFWCACQTCCWTRIVEPELGRTVGAALLT